MTEAGRASGTVSDPTGEGKRTPGAQIRQVVIDAGRALLTEGDTVKALTIRAVAQRAGVAPMSVYNHFTDKDGLLAALVNDNFARLRDAVSAVDSSDPVTRLTESGRAYRRFAFAHPTLYGLMFSGDIDPDGEIAGAAFGSLTEIVRHGQAAGIVRNDSPQLLTMLIWNGVHGAVSLEMSCQPPFDDSLTADDKYEAMLEFIGRAIAATD